MEIAVAHYNSLVATPGTTGGNKAGVATLEAFPSPAAMQAVAAAVGFSETAFVVAVRPGVVAVRFFTPEGEVDLCGHATVAAFSSMPPGAYTMETSTQGALNVSVDADGRVYMAQVPPIFRPVPDVAAVIDALGLDAAAIDATVPMTIVSTGLPDIFVPIVSADALHAMRPDMAKIATLSTAWDTIGLHAFTLAPSEAEATAECRNFAPRFGIDEEAATGTSSGALGALLVHHGRATSPMVFSQGRGMGLPSRIGCHIATQPNGTISEVQINGVADMCGGQVVAVSDTAT
ncbi:phenazine biosynthesis protein PhzF [Achlya hypogyna]|uniref:Phenazine biosynthesis protein PhzF n=1 Tax=Achlya hypogyna TaxID=1202772 RepID=A0A1V9YQI6_ACHHY|nr:phenazine biosynthesis protein PhzF [Achlya hypogyna]